MNQIRKKKRLILFRKLSKLYGIPLMLLAVPTILMIRLLRPLILIRFGCLMSLRIGHFSVNTEVYLCRRDVNKNKKPTLDLFYYHEKMCNKQLGKMWKRILYISYIANWFDKANRLIPGWEKHVVSVKKHREGCYLLRDVPVHLSFTAREEQLGQDGLRKLGIPNCSPFVCFCSRDSAYLDTVFLDENWYYHSYRDTSIHNYIPAAKELVRRGYFAIRMGAIVKERLTTTNKKIIDYATSSRTDFMDIFLSAKCKFFLSPTVGLAGVPIIFRRPIAWVNFIPLEYVWTWNSNDLFIPKKLWLRKEGRFMTFREILSSGTGRLLRTDQYERIEVEPVENTSEEITALAVEMDERLKGTWQTTEEDEELQKHSWSIFKRFSKFKEFHQVLSARIGAEFLRQNRELLE